VAAAERALTAPGTGRGAAEKDAAARQGEVAGCELDGRASWRPRPRGLAASCRRTRWRVRERWSGCSGSRRADRSHAAAQVADESIRELQRGLRDRIAGGRRRGPRRHGRGLAHGRRPAGRPAVDASSTAPRPGRTCRSRRDLAGLLAAADRSARARPSRTRSARRGADERAEVRAGVPREAAESSGGPDPAAALRSRTL
jgi:hypothetical protein